MDPLTIITASWSVFKLGYDVIKFINNEFPEKGLDHFRIFVSNYDFETVYVALKYYSNDSWKTKKWMKFSVGETALVLDNLHTNLIYIYACNENNEDVIISNDHIDVIDGIKRGFRKVNLGNKFCNTALELAVPSR